MVDPDVFLESSRAAGFGLWTGVPCSYLTSLIDEVIADQATRYLPAANEGDAVAVAAGSRLGGTAAVVLMQNSGLGNAVNPLTSLCDTLRIPVLLIVTLRGAPDGPADEPQHALMGSITTDLLELMNVDWSWFPAQNADVAESVHKAADRMRVSQRPYAFVMKQGSVSPAPSALRPEQRRPGVRDLPSAVAPRAGRRDWLAAAQAAVTAEDVVIASTGYLGRELCALDDRPNQLYLVGSMGCASSLGLGIALAQPSRRVLVLEGDGAGLMRLGAWSAVGHANPPNLKHVLLDNGCHESTGAQPTLAGSVDFCGLAAASGYAKVDRLADPSDFADWLAAPADGPAFLHTPILRGTPASLPRPRHPPPVVARRFAAQLGVTL